MIYDARHPEAHGTTNSLLVVLFLVTLLVREAKHVPKAIRPALELCISETRGNGCGRRPVDRLVQVKLCREEVTVVLVAVQWRVSAPLVVGVVWEGRGHDARRQRCWGKRVNTSVV